MRRVPTPYRAAVRAAALLAALLPLAAAAHDTWFAPLKPARPDELRLALTTGNRFPLQETGVDRHALVAQGCRSADGVLRALVPRRDAARALELALPAPGAAQTCWAQTAPLRLTLPPDKVALYLDEIRAPKAVRQRAAELAARGVPWQETYAKHARLQWRRPGPPPHAGPHRAAPPSVPMALDIVPVSDRPVAGEPWSATVLRDGEPLPHFDVELVHAGTGLGFWLRTDEAGRVQVRPSLAGDWLLRGTDLRPHPTERDAWESRFVTLAVQVAPGPGPNLNPNPH